MNSLIGNVSKGIIWDKDRFYFVYDDSIEYSVILIEYLNDLTLEVIENELRIICDFDKSRSSLDSGEFENYLMSTFDGFTKYEDECYVFIAGSNDLSPSVLYSIENDETFLIHPNVGVSEKFMISTTDLISLLRTKKDLLGIL